ncbi:MAG: hypothetical protein RL885_07195 [Planctomycetota bacterium]
MRARSRTFPPNVSGILSVILVTVLFGVTTAQERTVALPGLAARGDSLPRPQAGRLLLGELMCNACHPGLPVHEELTRSAPDLADVGGRLSPGYLARFIADPSGTHPGNKMPSLLMSETPAKREEIARSIAAFLIDRSASQFETTVTAQEEDDAGAELFHTLGCVVCHSPRRPALPGSQTPSATDAAVDLSIVPKKYSLTSLTSFLYDPLRIRPSGRMPDLGLRKSEASTLAGYLLQSGTSHESPSAPSGSIEAGRRYFVQFRCASCHALDGLETPDPIGIRPGSIQGGCLADSPREAPLYALSSGDRAALTAALSESSTQPSPEEQVSATLTAFHCYGCHARDDIGGVTRETNPYFTTSEPELGDEARIPPPLTGVGAKLRDEWLRKVLFERGRARSYMHTRMPHYGEASLRHLPDLLLAQDTIEPFEIPALQGEAHNEARDAGRELMGQKGLSCISCHDFNGKPSTNMQGIDLINTTERLTPSWFARFLRKPGSIRPGTVMPEFWPGGVAVHPDILGGDTNAQIRALWIYLSDGRTARDPEGLRFERTLLGVSDEPVLYRGRSNVAGFRGIAIGFPGGWNLAFDARNGSLAALWRGDFVRVNWSGQAAGDFDPAARPIRLASDVSFWRLPNDDAPWPLAPVTTKEEPINPDPDYPRNLGFRFLGYSLDPKEGPTLRYRSGDVRIEDRFEPDGDRLTRFLILTAPEADRIDFRVLAGELSAPGEHTYETKALRVTVPDVPRLVREGSPKELLLRLDLPAGETVLRLDYEIR